MQIVCLSTMLKKIHGMGQGFTGLQKRSFWSSKTSRFSWFLSYFFVTKIPVPLSWHVGYITDGSMDE